MSEALQGLADIAPSCCSIAIIECFETYRWRNFEPAHTRLSAFASRDGFVRFFS